MRAPDSGAGYEPQEPEWDEEPPPPRTASWAPVDLSEILAGTYRPPVPTLLRRTDGQALLYPGLTHSFHGEPESGKSMLAQYLAATLTAEGKRVLYLDYESDPASIVGRLLMLGASRESLAGGRFVYVQPTHSPTASGAERAEWLRLIAEPFALAVIDGVTAALVTCGFESIDNDQVTRWAHMIPTRIAEATGAAVVMVDHVPKDAQNRGRFAIGAQAKLAVLSGAAFTLEPKEQLGVGLRGVVSVRASKDRPGQLRRHGIGYRWNDRTTEMAQFIVDSTGPSPVVSLVPPAPAQEGKPFRPTQIMENMSRELEKAPSDSQKKTEALVSGNTEHKRKALHLLVSEGFVSVTPGARGAKVFASMRPYRQTDDPASTAYTGQADLASAVAPDTRPVDLARSSRRRANETSAVAPDARPPG